MRRIQIDLNCRNASGQTPAVYTGPTPKLGDAVIAFEPEDGVRVNAVVAGIKPDRSLVLLNIDWQSIRDDTPDLWSRVTTGIGTAETATKPVYGPVWHRTSHDSGTDGSRVGRFERREPVSA